MRVLNIKETTKTRGGGGLITGWIFLLKVDGPITGGAYKLISGSLRYRPTQNIFLIPDDAVDRRKLGF